MVTYDASLEVRFVSVVFFVLWLSSPFFLAFSVNSVASKERLISTATSTNIMWPTSQADDLARTEVLRFPETRFTGDRHGRKDRIQAERKVPLGRDFAGRSDDAHRSG